MSGTWNQLPFFFLGFLQVEWSSLGLGHRHELAEVARMWFAGCQRLGSVEMAKFDDILTPEKGGTCLNCPSVSGTIISIFSIELNFFGSECVETRKRKTNCQVHKGFCLLSNQMNSWGLVGSLSQPSRFFEVPCFFWGMDTAQWNYMKLWGNVKSNIECPVVLTILLLYFFQVIILPCWYEMYLRSIP